MANSNFDEKSGIVAHNTDWGKWYQTVAEVTIEVDLEEGTRGKEVQVDIHPNSLKCVIRGKLLFEVINVVLLSSWQGNHGYYTRVVPKNHKWRSHE
jgi:hypothetical protein